VKGLVLQADRALALEKARKARAERFVRITHNGDSTSFLSARMDTGAALALQDAIRRITGRLVDEGAIDPVPELEVQALEELAAPYLPGIDGASPTTEGALSAAGVAPAANPAPRLPLADVVVHIGAEDLDPGSVGTGVARVIAAGGDVGSVLVPQIANLLRHHRIRVIPVIDMAGDPSVDAYEIPTPHKDATPVAGGLSVFPYSSRRSRSCDLDHTVPIGSPDPMFRRRRVRPGPRTWGRCRAGSTGRRLTVRGCWISPPPGLYVWTNRTGHRWAVINGHTFQLPAA
jgi:hypothetical protein